MLAVPHAMLLTSPDRAVNRTYAHAKCAILVFQCCKNRGLATNCQSTESLESVSLCVCAYAYACAGARALAHRNVFAVKSCVPVL